MLRCSKMKLTRGKNARETIPNLQQEKVLSYIRNPVLQIQICKFIYLTTCIEVPYLDKKFTSRDVFLKSDFTLFHKS